MFCDWKKFIFILTAVIIVAGTVSPPAHAIWHPLLNEHFNRDQQNPNNLWPWITDLRNRTGWHWNPRRPHLPHRPTEGAWTDYCWGVQDYIFSVHITPHDDINQSIWCAYTNRNLVNEPRWPEDDDYMNLQNAWTWWGPFSLEDATAAAVSYWIYVDLRDFSYDSLTIVVVDDPGLLTLNDDDFHESVTWGKSYNHRIQDDWSFRYFYLDSLNLGPEAEDDEDLVSVIGSEEVYLAFVWQTNRFGITGTGAFVDDVIISWDDGLFELTPLEALFGYPEPEADTIYWEDEWPVIDDEVRFRMSYTARGAGDLPDFDINLYLDDELIYTENVSIEASDSTIYIVEADTLWPVVEGEHTLRWELDAPAEDGGEVEEADEENNIEIINFNVIYNPPPVFEFTEQGEELTLVEPPNSLFINWTIEDEPPDEEFRLFLFWTDDTAGLAESEDPAELVFQYGLIMRDFGVGLGAGEYEWEAETRSEEGYTDLVPEGQHFWIVSFVADGYPGNFDIDISEGQYYWEPLAIDPGTPEGQTPSDFGIVSAFPNPFNQSLKVDYTLNNASDILLGVYDMSGRFVTGLASGIRTVGRYSAVWNPGASPAGVYLIRLNSADQSALKKVVYMP